MRLSVIIPTYNRAASLRDTLLALGQQTLPSDQFEIVVVDDGSTDDTSAVAQASHPSRVTYVRQHNQGSAAARNAGAARSAGDVLVFIDDDILPRPAYLETLLEQHAQFPNIVGMGALYPHLDAGASPFERYVERSMPDRTASAFVHFAECTSNNLSIEREAFFRLGAWRDVCGDGQTLWGDVEFGYRAARAGLRCRRAVEAICFHRDYAMRDLTTNSRRMQLTATLAHELFRIHPELEAHLPMFRDMSPVRLPTDGPVLAIRKLLRGLSASPSGVALMEQLAHFLERSLPIPALLDRVYRLVVGAYIYRGYQLGLPTASGRLPAVAKAQ